MGRGRRVVRRDDDDFGATGRGGGLVVGVAAVLRDELIGARRRQGDAWRCEDHTIRDRDRRRAVGAELGEQAAQRAAVGAAGACVEAVGHGAAGVNRVVGQCGGVADHRSDRDRGSVRDRSVGRAGADRLRERCELSRGGIDHKGLRTAGAGAGGVVVVAAVGDDELVAPGRGSVETWRHGSDAVADHHSAAAAVCPARDEAPGR